MWGRKIRNFNLLTERYVSQQILAKRNFKMYFQIKNINNMDPLVCKKKIILDQISLGPTYIRKSNIQN